MSEEATAPAVSTAGAHESRWARGPLRPFRIGQYRLLAGSVTLALFASGVWMIALVWQVIALDGGPTQLSFVATAGAAGMLATTLLGGVLADRVPQRRILAAVSVSRTISVAVLAALSLGGLLEVWHLAVAALLIGFGNGLQYPAYSALLPSVVPAEDLLAVNGFEGMLRPTIMQAAGPAVASLIIAASSPGAALAVVAALEAAGVALLLVMRAVPLRRDLSAETQHPVRAAVTDMREGFVYMVRTPWLLATLLFAAVLILLIMGPIEVLLPFVIKNRAGGGPGDHAVVMAAFGIGGALGSMGMASFRLPRRYLTVMNLCWGAGCIPLAVVGFSRDITVIAGAVFLVGVFFSAPMVIWGTLLQRRVPAALLGRVSSLDFFVSLVFMPISMALAGPVAALIGLGSTFLLAGLVPTLLAIAAIVLAKLPQDEIAHPLDVVDDETPAEGSAADITPSESLAGLPQAA
jgi:Transmembrane secretion effector